MRRKKKIFPNKKERRALRFYILQRSFADMVCPFSLKLQFLSASRIFSAASAREAAPSFS